MTRTRLEPQSVLQPPSRYTFINWSGFDDIHSLTSVASITDGFGWLEMSLVPPERWASRSCQTSSSCSPHLWSCHCHASSSKWVPLCLLTLRSLRVSPRPIIYFNIPIRNNGNSYGCILWVHKTKVIIMQGLNKHQNYPNMSASLPRHHQLRIYKGGNSSMPSSPNPAQWQQLWVASFISCLQWWSSYTLLTSKQLIFITDLQLPYTACIE